VLQGLEAGIAVLEGALVHEEGVGDVKAEVAEAGA